MDITLEVIQPTAATSLLPVIFEYSRRSCEDKEGNDVVIHFLERGIFLETGRKSPFLFYSEIGNNGEVILTSLESMIQFGMLQAKDSQPSSIARRATEQTQLSPAIADVIEEPMVYEPLPGPNWTRLFRLDRMVFTPIGPKAFHVSMSGSLRAFELNSMPIYRALSYTWAWPYEINTFGASQEKIEISSPITCNGRDLHLLGNLFQALCYMGSAGISGWLWIDAICINQEDGKEKADLICQMDSIYSNAAEVIGCLVSPICSLET